MNIYVGALPSLNHLWVGMETMHFNMTQSSDFDSHIVGPN